MFDIINAKSKYNNEQLKIKYELQEQLEINKNERVAVICAVIANCAQAGVKHPKKFKAEDFYKAPGKDSPKKIKKQSVEEQAKQLKIFNQMIGGKTN